MRLRLRRRAVRILNVSVSTDVATYPRRGEWSILLADDATLRELNATYRQRDEATDVLSFAFADEVADDAVPTMLPEEAMERLLGDVVISIEQALRQTPDDLENELLRLLVHGYCHLQGYDHDDSGERQAMVAAEGRLLDLFGVDTGLTDRAQ